MGLRFLKALFKDILMHHELEKYPLYPLIIITKWKWGNEENAADKVWWIYFVISTDNVVVSQPNAGDGGMCVMEAAIQSEQIARLVLDIVRKKEMTKSYSNNSKYWTSQWFKSHVQGLITLLANVLCWNN